MTTYYVGLGGNDGNAGTSWAARKLTLNGAEDVPVVAGDTVYVAPGVYRELLTCDVSGSSGSPITYIGDVTGEHTDGVGGIVRITGSDNDQTATRANCITATSKNYRTFRGFEFDSTSDSPIKIITSTNWTISDGVCYVPYNLNGIYIEGATQATISIQRMYLIIGAIGSGIYYYHSDDVSDSGHTVSNCVFIGSHQTYGARSGNIGGIAFKNCLFYNGGYGFRISSALAGGQTITVNNCILHGLAVALNGTVAGEIVENYNSLSYNQTDRTNVDTGANSNTYPPLFNPPILLDGFRFPWFFGELSKWSQLARIAGTSEATDDLFGITRPATSAKKSWGAIQATGAARETTTTYDSSASSLKLPDAAELFLMRVPVTNTSTTFALRVYREADYAGDLPQMIVRQAGQSDNTDTDTGDAGAWNELSITCTPAANPGWVDIFVVSRNTATSGNYDTFFDNVTVT